MSETSFALYGQPFTFPSRYAAGHILTENEAAALNDRMGEMISHKIRALAAKAGMGKGDSFVGKDELLAQCNALLAEQVTAYEFGAGRGSSGPRVVLDPVAKKALELADAEVRRAIHASDSFKKVGKKDGSDAAEPGVYPWERFEAKRAEIAQREEIVSAAKKAVAAEQKATGGTVEL